VLPVCNCEAMQLHLDEIATKVTPGAHAILVLDQAGWHGAKSTGGPEQHLARYRRPLLLRLEHTHRPTLENHVHRATRLGSSRSLNLRIGIRDVPGEMMRVELFFGQTQVERSAKNF
jgi:hypothetical protein